MLEILHQKSIGKVGTRNDLSFISTLESKARSDKETCTRSHVRVTRELELQSKTLCFTSIIVEVTFNVCS